MHTMPSPSTEPGDWLVVIERLEASVFRSLESDAVPQVIRSQLSRDEPRVGSAAQTHQDRDERPPLPGFFEPLAGVLHGAQRILIFGRSVSAGDATGPFTAWLRGGHPEIARRIITSVQLDAQEQSDAEVLAKARTIYELAAVAALTRTALRYATPPGAIGPTSPALGANRRKIVPTR